MTVLTFDPTWRTFAGVQGGLLVGHLLSAAVALTGAPPRAVTAHLLRGVVPGSPVTVAAVPDRRGTTSSVRAELHQDGELRAVGQVLTLDRPVAAVPAEPGPSVDEGEPLALPVELVPIAAHTEVRALGAPRPLAAGPEPRLHAWVRLPDLTDPLVHLAAAVDALPPSLFAVWSAPRPLPTVELTMHLTGLLPPAGAWLRIEQCTTWCDDSLAVDDARVWNAEGRPVARARQTRRLTNAGIGRESGIGQGMTPD